MGIFQRKRFFDFAQNDVMTSLRMTWKKLRMM